MNFWLFKSEPNCYSIEDLERDKTTHWDGVRNYQARNFLRDDCALGDQVLFYHSNCQEIGVYGIAKVVKNGYADHTAWDPNSDHPDPASTEEHPRWYMVDIEFVTKFKNPVTLELMRSIAPLSDMLLLRKGNRLSVLPITKKHFETISDLGV